MPRTTTAAPATIIAPSLAILGGRTVALEDATIIHAFAMGKDIGIVSISSYKQKPGLDVRRFYLDTESDTWKPTAKGLRMPVEVAEPLCSALQAYVASVR